jgi:hypothetical protein
MKAFAEKALGQLNENEWNQPLSAEENSCAIIMQQMAGNLLSRWTDFLTSDGKKTWRNRDAEFKKQTLTRVELMDRWQKGWNVLFAAINPLTPDRLMQTIAISGEAITVTQALLRQATHYSYHVGQFIFLARHLKGESWENLSIAKNQSATAKAAYLNQSAKTS